MINGRNMCIPPKYHKHVKEFIDKHLKAGRIRSSSSSVTSGTMCVPKKDTNAPPRFVHDYREVNSNTIPDHTPLPAVEDVLYPFAKAKVRAKIDMTDAYYQLLVASKDVYKTAFKTPFGLFEWLVMPQGLCNAPASCQRYLSWILREYISTICAVYLDDITIYSNSIEEHKQNLHLILQTLRAHGIILSANKSTLFADRIEFLGHVVSSRGIEAAPDKLRKSQNFPTPQSPEDIKSFTGMTNYRAQFDYIPGLADHSSVLTDLTKKGVPFQWGEQHDVAFETIKRLVRNIQLLQHLDYKSGEPVWLVADASKRGVGGYVAQGKDWKTARPIGFYSRQYRPAENYPTHEQEMLAIVSCMKHWLPQLTGTRFEVLSDHAPLQHWKTQKDLSRRQVRWLNFLCNFDFDINYIPGITNTAADALSRYPFAQARAHDTEVNATTTMTEMAMYRNKSGSGPIPVRKNPDRIGLLLGSVPAYFGPECLGGRCNRNRIGFEDLYDRTGTKLLEFRPDLDIQPEFRSCNGH